MKIEELLSEKNDDEKIDIEGICIPVSALKKLMRDGYAHSCRNCDTYKII
ncbi:MAG: hypothetical protein JRF08_07440 [Deltaproteobacteria bacterium]|nr:hypothetical protein [Deltaproteobacteria bacterium]